MKHLSRLLALLLAVLLAVPASAFADDAYITLPDDLEEIEAEAFKNTQIYSILLPSGLRRIGEGAFENSELEWALIPPSVTSIASNAFNGNPSVYVMAREGSYAETWCDENNVVCITDNTPIIAIDAPSATFAGATVTCHADVSYCWEDWGYEWDYDWIYPYYDGPSYRWQRSADNANWTDATVTGSRTATISFPAESAYLDDYYRCAVTDPLGTWYSDSFQVGITTEKPVITGAVAEGNQVTLTWTKLSVSSCTYTIEGAKGSGAFSVFAEDLTDDSWILPGLSKSTEYRFRVVAVIGSARMESEPVSVTTQDYDMGSVYRALLIGEVNFSPICNRNGGDVSRMADMLSSVTGPTGGRYQVTRRLNLSKSAIQSAIETTFASATENDVSLFFIATHGNTSSSGTYAGALATVDADGNQGTLTMSALAGYLSQVPGKVIVILESCGAGAGIYDPDVAENVKRGTEAAQDSAAAFTAAAISAFASRDPGVDLAPTVYLFDENGDPIPQNTAKTGELRQAKFYVLAAARYHQYSWGTESGPYNYFTYDLTNGIGLSGSMPADTDYGDSDGFATLHELFSYIKDVGDARDYYDSDTGEYVHQNVQVYPTNCSYELFTRNAD